jgi:hypothetical protein
MQDLQAQLVDPAIASSITLPIRASSLLYRNSPGLDESDIEDLSTLIT